ncbi:dipeptidase 2-like [Arapaima gigas]
MVTQCSRTQVVSDEQWHTVVYRKPVEPLALAAEALWQIPPVETTRLSEERGGGSRGRGVMSPVKTLFFCFLCTSSWGSELGERVQQLMAKYPLIDGHNDLALQLRILHDNRLSQIDLYNLSKVATDIHRLQTGHVGAQMFAAYVMCKAQEKDAVRLTIEQIDVIRRMCTEYPDLELVTSAQGLMDSRKIACLMSIEGGHSIDSSLPTLRMFYQLGVRSMALTHTCNTPWAKSSSNFYPFYRRENKSLTQFGKAVVMEMNRLGMIVDLSHSSWETARSVLEISTAPIIFSHSSAFKVCEHVRNVPDWLLVMLKKNRGIIMVNMHSGFIACNEKGDVSIVADHFEHIKKVAGFESIGIGGDYDGAPKFPDGLEDVSKYPALIEELVRRNWTEHELASILRLNFLRVFQEVEKVRDEERSQTPSEAQIPLEEAVNPCRLTLTHPVLSSVSGSILSLTPSVNVLTCSVVSFVLLLFSTLL